MTNTRTGYCIPSGSPGVRHIFHIFAKFAKFVRQVHIFRTKYIFCVFSHQDTTHQYVLVKDFAKAWPLPCFHVGLPITPLSASPASSNWCLWVLCRSDVAHTPNCWKTIFRKRRREHSRCAFDAQLQMLLQTCNYQRDWSKTRKYRKYIIVNCDMRKLAAKYMRYIWF